jgi:hypothetical protein
MGTTTKISARVLTVLLGVAAATVLWVGVWPTVLSGNGLDVKSRIGWHNPPMPGPQFEPSVAVQPDRGLRERWSVEEGTAAPETLFPWRDTANGTVDAATGRPPVEVSPWGNMRLYLAGPTAQDRLAQAGPRLAVHALVLFVIWLLWRIVRTLPTGEVFTAANGRRMVGIGLAVALGGSAVQLLAYAGERDIIARSAAAGILKAAFSFSFLPLVVGAVLILLAEIFRQGVRLRTEVDGLV